MKRAARVILFKLLRDGILSSRNGVAGGNNTAQRRKGVAFVQRPLLKNVTWKHKLGISWWRTCTDMKWLQMDNDDPTGRKSL